MLASAGAADVDVRLLGGVDVVVGGASVALGGAKPRAMLAYLALQPGQSVSADRIVDGVWGDAAPPSVRGSLQVHVSNLRKSLGSVGCGSLIETRRGGYVFTGDPDAVDVHRFGQGARSARSAFQSGNLGRAVVAARDARLLWRGVPLAGLGDAPFVAAQAAGLEDDFLSLVELLADIEIALGRPSEVIGELEQLVVEHPYREGAWCRLALALFRSGRQVDALERLRTVRTVLLDDLGLDASPDIKALELAILNQDPALRGPQPSAPHAPLIAPGEQGASRLPPSRPLLGRDTLADELVRSIDTNALVTVIGPGGVGKTALAILAAGRVAADGSATARFVDLTTIDSDDDVLSSVAAALGLQVGAHARIEDALGAALSAFERPLLVLDNCEHVLHGARRCVEALLERVPRLGVLATSREPLGLPEEHVLACTPLADDVAVDLFVARAQTADRQYVVTPAELVAIRALTARLDALPLAIELFAAHAGALSAVGMVAQLDDVGLLSATFRAVDAGRHRTLHDVIDWSYALLDESERRCLRRMSVFAGSADLAAVDAVCELSHIGVLANLVERSLVVAERTAVGTRYRLLVTVRAFAADALAAEPDDAALTRRRLAEHTESWGRQLRHRLEGPDPADALAELGMNAANVRAAFDVTMSGDGGDPGRAADLLLAFGVWGATTSSDLPDVGIWASAVAERLDADDVRRVGLVAIAARRAPEGTERHAKSLADMTELAERSGASDWAAVAWALYSQALTDVSAPAALAAAERAIELGEQHHLPLVTAWSVLHAGSSLVRLRRTDEALALLDRHSVAGTRAFGVNESLVLFIRGRAHMLSGDLEAARRAFDAGEAAAVRTASAPGLTAAFYGQAEVARLGGDIGRAHDLYARCLPIDVVTEPGEVPLVRMMIAWTACLLGRLDVAEQQVEALDSQLQTDGVVAGDKPTMNVACITTAHGLLALAKGLRQVAEAKLRWAVHCWAASDSWDVVADLLDRMPEAVGPGDETERYPVLARQLRIGELDLADVLAAVPAGRA